MASEPKLEAGFCILNTSFFISFPYGGGNVGNALWGWFYVRIFVFIASAKIRECEGSISSSIIIIIMIIITIVINIIIIIIIIIIITFIL